MITSATAAKRGSKRGQRRRTSRPKSWEASWTSTARPEMSPVESNHSGRQLTAWRRRSNTCWSGSPRIPCARTSRGPARTAIGVYGGGGLVK
eukprot:4722388-Pyramimonas_sp.AAC.3